MNGFVGKEIKMEIINGGSHHNILVDTNSGSIDINSTTLVFLCRFFFSNNLIMLLLTIKYNLITSRGLRYIWFFNNNLFFSILLWKN